MSVKLSKHYILLRISPDVGYLDKFFTLSIFVQESRYSVFAQSRNFMLQNRDTTFLHCHDEQLHLSSLSGLLFYCIIIWKLYVTSTDAQLTRDVSLVLHIKLSYTFQLLIFLLATLFQIHWARPLQQSLQTSRSHHINSRWVLWGPLLMNNSIKLLLLKQMF